MKSLSGGAETDVDAGICLNDVVDDQLVHVGFVRSGIPRLREKQKRREKLFFFYLQNDISRVNESFTLGVEAGRSWHEGAGSSAAIRYCDFLLGPNFYKNTTCPHEL